MNNWFRKVLLMPIRVSYIVILKNISSLKKRQEKEKKVSGKKLDKTNYQNGIKNKTKNSNLLNIIFLYLSIKGSFADTKQFSGLLTIVANLRKRINNCLFLKLIQR